MAGLIVVNGRFSIFIALAALSAITTACSGPTPAEVVGEDRITLEEAATQAADAIKGFRLRLAGDKRGQDGSEAIVPAEYKTGLQFCTVELKFYVSAKADRNGTLTLSIPLTMNFAGPNPPMNTLNPQIGGEAGGTNSADRNNTITLRMENPSCQNFKDILTLLDHHPDLSADKLANIIKGSVTSSQQAQERE